LPCHPATGDGVKTRGELRRELRRRRAGLSPQMRARAAGQIARHVARGGWLRPGRAVAMYVAVGSEADTLPLRRLAARAGCAIFLPRITSYAAHRMLFWRDRGRYRPNRLGIPEPVSGPACPARRLDAVFMPLTAFNTAGYRLGVGGGYYDRYFAFRRRAALRRPLLIGIAFDCQRSSEFAPDAHDVPLDLVVTECGIVDWRRGRGSRS
jgi:5-formyltetrahydrofolate cyclo-ligase